MARVGIVLALVTLAVVVLTGVAFALGADPAGSCGGG
jgi:hypothetical protein